MTISEIKVGDYILANRDIYDNIVHKNPTYIKDKKYRVIKVDIQPTYVKLTFHGENGITTEWFGINYKGCEFEFISLKEERYKKMESLWK